MSEIIKNISRVIVIQQGIYANDQKNKKKTIPKIYSNQFLYLYS